MMKKQLPLKNKKAISRRNNHNTMHYPSLKKRLILRTLLLDSLLLAAAGLWGPALIHYLIAGMGLGLFYLLSLMGTVDVMKPLMGKKAKLRQAVLILLSFIRIFLLGYLLVAAAEFKILQLTVVMSGFLSYKIILILEYFCEWQDQHHGQPPHLES